jgi:hypothetical protein
MGATTLREIVQGAGEGFERRVKRSEGKPEPHQIFFQKMLSGILIYTLSYINVFLNVFLIYGVWGIIF